MQHRTRECAAVAITANLPILLWGAPGTGKTSTVLSIGAALGLPVEVVIGSIREPSDFSGLPVLRDGATHFAPPRWAQRLSESGHGVLFLDELTTAPPSVQAAMLRVVLERAVGDLVLPDAVRIVAAANPPEQAADGWDLSAPLANRLIHLDWEIDAGAVADGFTSGFRVPELEASREPSPARVTEAMSHVGAFLRVRPTLLLVVPEDATAAGRAWPSPRSWQMASRALAATREAASDEEVTLGLITGAVGDAAAYELLSWLRNLDLPTPSDLLADPGRALPARVDQVHAVLGSLVAYVAADGTAGVWEKAWEVIAQAAQDSPDVAATAARALAGVRPDGCALPTSMLALAPVLRAAGLIA